jgi:hypothetical protein
MSNGDPLQDIAQKFTADLVSLYGGTSAGGACVAFLPGGVPVPDDLVQNGILNPTQVDTWLRTNFDSPLLVRPGDATVGARSSSTASDIYALAVTSAQPAGDINSPASQRVAGEIRAAQTAYGEPGGDKPIVCSPDDWALPGSQSYWATFDSSVATSTTTTTEGPPPPLPAVDPVLWRMRVQDYEIQVPPHEVPVFTRPGSLPIGRPLLARAISVSAGEGGQPTGAAPAILEAPQAAAPRVSLTAGNLVSAAGPAAAVATGSPTAISPATPLTVRSLEMLPPNLDYTVALSQAPTVQSVTTTDSSSLVVHLEHTCVSLSRALGGQSWWNEVFLADPGWYVPGMPSGTLLGAAPPPVVAPDGTTSGQQVFAIPIGLIIVRNLSVSGDWSAEAAQALSSSSASIGPLTLFGASSSSSVSGTSTYSRPGMQVVALLCAALPVLPPIDDPSVSPVATAPANSTSSAG